MYIDRSIFAKAGSRGLLAAIVHQATRDALHGGPDLARDAWQYFLSDSYSHHISCLGLDGYRLPRELLE